MTKHRANQESSTQAPVLAAPARDPLRRLIEGAALTVALAAAVYAVGHPSGAARGHPSGATPGPVRPAAHGPIATLNDPPGSQNVVALAFSPDGKLLASGDDNGTTYLRKLGTLRLVATLTDPPGESDGDYGVAAVAFSPDGKMLATGDDDGSSYLWDVATARLAATLRDPAGDDAGHTESPGPGPQVNALAFSHDGRILATGDDNGSCYLWDVATGRRIATLTDSGSAGVESVAFSPGGTTLATGDYNGGSYLWDVATGRRIATLTDPHHGEVMSVAFSPDGTTLAAGDWNGNAYLWNLRTRRLAATLTDPGPGGDSTSVVTWVSFTRDGATLATIDASLYLWNVTTRRLAGALGDPGDGLLDAAAFSPDGTILATGGGPGTYTGTATTYLWHTS